MSIPRSTRLVIPALAVLLLSGCGLVVQVRDPHGAPVQGARVIVQESGRSAETVTTDANGEVRLRRVAGAGDWTLEVTAKGFARQTVNHPQGQRIPVTMAYGDEYERWKNRVDGVPEPPPDDRR